MSFNLFEMFTHGVCALMPSALGTHYSFYLIYSSQLNIFNLPPLLLLFLLLLPFSLSFLLLLFKEICLFY
jgi:hypothetical protein